jgi:hypothetical protein
VKTRIDIGIDHMHTYEFHMKNSFYTHGDNANLYSYILLYVLVEIMLSDY